MNAKKFKTVCQHCGSKRTYLLTGYEYEVECKKCKKDMNTKFDFIKNTLILY